MMDSRVTQEEIDLHTEWSDAQAAVAKASRARTEAVAVYDDCVRRVQSARAAIDAWTQKRNAAENPVDRTDIILAGTGKLPADDSYREPGPSGQHRDHVALSPAQRAKGFVRPVRTAYRHVGLRPKNPTRDLTEEEHARYDQFGYVSYEEYPTGSGATGKFWTDEELKSGCGKVTTMQGRALSETYATDPGFYGSTFCIHCNDYFRVGEHGQFIWLENDGREIEKVGT